MKTAVSFVPIVARMLDLLDIPPDPVEEQALEHLADLEDIAGVLGVYHPFIHWAGKTYAGRLTETVKARYERELAANEVRNGLLRVQMSELSTMFDDRGIGIMFLKGSAGMLRGLYRHTSRYLSDVDILVQTGRENDAREVLRSGGYHKEPGHKVPPGHHHLEPYFHPGHTGSVELHREPHDYSMLERPVMPDIWRSAERITLGGRQHLVPSLQDHVWVAIRSDLLVAMRMPPLKILWELIPLVTSGEVTFPKLKAYVSQRRAPRIVDLYAYLAERYCAISPGIEYDRHLMENWERFCHSLLYPEARHSFRASRARSRAALFLAGPQVKDKVAFYRWVIPYEIRYAATKAPYLPSQAVAVWRAVVDSASFLLLFGAYALMARKNGR